MARKWSTEGKGPNIPRILPVFLQKCLHQNKAPVEKQKTEIFS